jgi:hypothetical protein
MGHVEYNLLDTQCLLLGDPLFLLTYINYTKGVIMRFIFMHIMYCDQIHPLLLFFLISPSSSFYTIFMSLIILFSHMCIKYFDHICPCFILFFCLLPSCYLPPYKQSLFYSHAIYLLKILEFLYEKEHAIVVFPGLAYFP